LKRERTSEGVMDGDGGELTKIEDVVGPCMIYSYHNFLKK